VEVLLAFPQDMPAAAPNQRRIYSYSGRLVGNHMRPTEWHPH